MIDTLIEFNDVKHVSMEEYFKGEEFAADMVKVKYAHTKPDGSLETPAEIFWRVASGLAAMEPDESDAEYYAKHWFSQMWQGWYRPGGSVIVGVGSKDTQSLLNCTTVPLQGDSIEAIAKCDYDVMKCAAFRQGLGIEASALRPRGARVNNAAQESTGIVPWVTKLVDNGKYVGQKGRMPALLISLKVTHPDIFEFIKAKTELGVIENANISIQITDEFMYAVKDDTEWELYFDFDNEQYERISTYVSARTLFKLICDTAHGSAEPGVQYIDMLQRGSMIHTLYTDTDDDRFKIISTNACSEKPLPAYGSCNLLSINMEMFSTDSDEYIPELEYLAPFMTRMADNVVSYELQNELSPVAEQAWILEQTREIGLGLTNIHGWFLKQNEAYASPASIHNATTFMQHYARNVFSASVALGVHKGNAPALSLYKSPWQQAMMRSSYFKNIINTFYKGSVEGVHHMRNMAHMSIAPTGSLSNTFPTSCLGSGVEPVIGPYYWRKTRAIEKGTYTHYFVVPTKILEHTRSLCTDDQELSELCAFSGSAQDPDGAIGKKIIPILEKWLPEGFCVPAHMVKPVSKINLMSALYKWMDASISVTYNLPTSTTPQHIGDIYMEAFNKGVRAVSVYVEGSREGILIFEDPITNAKKYRDAHKNDAVCAPEERPTIIMPNCAPKRPVEMVCDVHQTSIKGQKWVVLVSTLHDQPFEIFCGQTDEFYLPQACKSGVIRKQGKGLYELEVTIRRAPVIFKDIAGALMTDNEKALTRLLSLNLRHGVAPQFIVDQLKKTNGAITAFSIAISRVLSKYVGTYSLKPGANVCPMCGEPSLINEAGCIKCVNEVDGTPCTYSRCS